MHSPGTEETRTRYFPPHCDSSGVVFFLPVEITEAEDGFKTIIRERK